MDAEKLEYVDRRKLILIADALNEQSRQLGDVTAYYRTKFNEWREEGVVDAALDALATKLEGIGEQLDRPIDELFTLTRPQRGE